MSKDTRSPVEKSLRKFVAEVAIVTDGEIQQMLTSPNEVDFNENLSNYQIGDFDKLIIAAKLEQMYNYLNFSEDVIRQAQTAQDIIDMCFVQEESHQDALNNTVDEKSVDSSDDTTEECKDAPVDNNSVETSSEDDSLVEDECSDEASSEKVSEETPKQIVKKVIKKKTKKDE